MASFSEIRDNLEMIATIKNVASTYQEIANLRMRQIRERVLKNREFFEELLNTYRRIKAAYLLSLKRGWIRQEKTSFRQAEKKEVVIFLSANQFFYGSLILDVWKETQKYLQHNEADLGIVGRVGKYFSESSRPVKKEIFYFDINDVKPEKENLSRIIEFIKNYRKIIICHGRYDKVLSQRPIISEISGKFLFEEKFEKDYLLKEKERRSFIMEKFGFSEDVRPYLFEPSAEAVLDFFETEIIAVLFNQTVLEHQLARYASRVIAMHQATENAKTMEENLSISENKLKRQKINKRQIELFSAIQL